VKKSEREKECGRKGWLKREKKGGERSIIESGPMIGEWGGGVFVNDGIRVPQRRRFSNPSHREGTSRLTLSDTELQIRKILHHSQFGRKEGC